MLYYTDWCPFTYYGVPRVQTEAKEHNIPFKAVHITSVKLRRIFPRP